MSNKELREDAKGYFVPVILGSNSHAHKLSAKIFYKFGIQPLVVDKKRSFSRFFDPYCYFVKLVPSDDDIIISEQLGDIVRQMPQTQAILIPCSEKYKRFVNEHLLNLEQVFIISQPENVFSGSPLAKILQ